MLGFVAWAEQNLVLSNFLGSRVQEVIACKPELVECLYIMLFYWICVVQYENTGPVIMDEAEFPIQGEKSSTSIFPQILQE